MRDLYFSVIDPTSLKRERIDLLISKLKGDSNPTDRLKIFLDETESIFKELGQQQGIERFISEVKARADLRPKLSLALGIEDPFALIEELYLIDRLALELGSEFRPELQPLSTIKEWCIQNKIGEFPEIWTSPLHPGTFIRVPNSGSRYKYFLVLNGPSCDSPSDSRIIDIDELHHADEKDIGAVCRYLKLGPTEPREGDFPSIVRKRSIRESIVRLMNYYDTIGLKIEHLLRQYGDGVEFYTGLEWKILNSQKLS